MQLWMRGAFARGLDAKDFRSLRSALSLLSRMAPPGYGSWASIARDGSEAAAVEDADAVTASCRGCHDQYAGRYKKEMQGKKL